MGVMYHIIVNTGTIPENELSRSIILPIDSLTEERNIVSMTHEVLSNVEPDSTLCIATNNTITLYTIRAYMTKHYDEGTIEYRHYNGANYKSIRQGERGDLIGNVDNFFDAIDRLLLEMLGLD